MYRILVVLVAGTAAIGAAPSVWAHAFLDHASPAVGSSVPAAPPAVTIFPSDWRAMAFADSLPELRALTTIPPEPKLVSTLPSGLKRASAV